MKSFFLSLSVLAVCAEPIESFSQENNAPVVKIIDPLNMSKCNPGGAVSYRIKVSDKEDGESEYGEIATNEVFLEVRYVTDASKVAAEIVADPVGLATMKKSNCFTCHAFNGKLIAPSFNEIAKRYSSTPTTLDLLAKRIREGSGGNWGTASMPSHTELTTQQTKEIADWILKNGHDENLNYYPGTEGTFKMKRSDQATSTGAFVLSATYSDLGGSTSKDVIVVYFK